MSSILLEKPQEPIRYFDLDMEQSEMYPLARGHVGIYSARCPGKQTPNEDAAAVVPFARDSAVIVIADGMGGVPSGEQAAALAVRAVISAVEKAAAEDGQMLRTAILNGMEKANRAVQNLAVGAATTLAVVEVQGEKIRPYHVGDSMILVVGQRGKIKLQTVSHSPVGYGVEAGFLDEEEAMEHENRHVVSNVVGDPQMRIEMGPTIKLAPRDTLLLASDGLVDNLHLHEIIERLRKGSLEKIMHSLSYDAGRRMLEPEKGLPSKPDDMTIVVFRRKWKSANSS